MPDAVRCGYGLRTFRGVSPLKTRKVWDPATRGMPLRL